MVEPMVPTSTPIQFLFKLSLMDPYVPISPDSPECVAEKPSLSDRTCIKYPSKPMSKSPILIT
ncbi:hypothetical protein F383_06156 [Gossypium arboreum]|uniref:Uncharacterized protein n=1 Tax=Gossypium arboreum TaxID=29729 RepID=A0A0B0NDE3_GOSAR|nr:hypothetical protein F383_06156 [Gossypium arboreum]